MLDLVLKRRSVRQYLSKEINEADLKDILAAGLLAPTSMNRRPGRFYVIKKKEVLEKLADVKKAVDEDRTATWIEDSSSALSFMQLEAADKNIGSCWVQIRLRSNEEVMSETKVREILDLSDKDRIVGILALGYPENEVKPHTLDEIDWSKVQEV